MDKTDFISEFSNWDKEIISALVESKAQCVALFSKSNELIFANDAMYALQHNLSAENFINPSFKKLTDNTESDGLIFKGFITLGEVNKINSSIWAQVFKKDGFILVLGGMDALQLTEQNKSMHALNREIGNLQRDLIKEKHNLENTLNKLNETNKTLNELNATKDKFFSIIAHDLSAPFNTILGFSEVLMGGDFANEPNQIQEFARIINESSQNAFELLNDLLEWSRLQMGKIKPDFKELQLSSLLEDLTVFCKPIAQSKSIHLNTLFEKDIVFKADKKMMDTILRNLVSNAIKFTYINGKIEIKVRLSNNSIVFSIADTGIGIEPEYLTKLFEVDCPLSKRGTNDEKGTGLGLILCKEFVEKHNGKIWVESKLNTGSTFSFSIPLN